MTIYKIDQSILDCIDEDGEIIDVEAFESLQMERTAKIDNIVCWYKQLNAEVSGIKSEQDALGERKKQKENQAERLKVFLSNYLDGERFETARSKISWRKSESVVISGEDKIPKDFRREIITLEPDKAAIKEQIKAGSDVPGAELVAKNNIQIK